MKPTLHDDDLMRTTLVAIRHSGHLGAFHQRIKARRGVGKAIICYTLKCGWAFEEFPALKIADRISPLNNHHGE